MSLNPFAAVGPRARGLARSLRFCAAALALHGLLLWLSTAVSIFPDGFDLTDAFRFWILVVPALILASPFTAVLRNVGLLDAPGWFAWPQPLGIALAYTIWVVVLIGLAQLVQRCEHKH